MTWQSGSFKLLLVSAAPGVFSGLFVYSPAPGPGNLIGSWASSAGTDPYGNAYPQGLSSAVGNLSGQTIIASVFQGVNLRIDQNGIFLYQTVVLPIPPPPPPIPYFIGSQAVNAGSNPVTIPVTNATSANDTIHVAANAAHNTSTLTSVTDSQGNTYTFRNSGDNLHIPTAVFTADNTNNGAGTHALSTADTITVTYSGTTGAKCAIATGISNLNANPTDQLAAADGNSSTPSVISGVLAQAAEVAIASLGSSNSGGVPVFGTGWTQLARAQLGTGQYLTVAYFDVSTADAVLAPATLAAAGNWTMLIITLKE